MSSRRKFITSGIIGAAGISLLPAINVFAGERYAPAKSKFRFAIASDGHYAQPGTDGDKFYSDLIKWLNKDHQDNHLDMIIINGDLVHNRPDLLPKVKETYLDKLPVPYYTIPGNHDFADAAVWKGVFGYEDNYVVDKGDIAFVFANTADTKGGYTCPNPAFMKKALEQCKDKKIVFVILHIAPYQWFPEEKGTFTNCPEIIDMLHSYPNVKAAFHGHDHNLDGIRYTGKLPHLFDSHFGGSWGTEYKGYRIVEVDAANKITTYQVNASQSPLINKNQLAG